MFWSGVFTGYAAVLLLLGLHGFCIRLCDIHIMIHIDWKFKQNFLSKLTTASCFGRRATWPVIALAMRRLSRTCETILPGEVATCVVPRFGRWGPLILAPPGRACAPRQLIENGARLRLAAHYRQRIVPGPSKVGRSEHFLDSICYIWHFDLEVSLTQ